jgi:hypothetical protein
MAEGKRYRSWKEAGGRGGWRGRGMDWRVAGKSEGWRDAGGCGWRKMRDGGILEKGWRDLGMEGCRMVVGESEGWRDVGGWLERRGGVDGF